MPISIRMMLLAAACPIGCHCADKHAFDMDSSTSASSGEASTSSSTSSDTSTGEPFDASRWIGRYHDENPFLAFGERGDPHGSYTLVNFEILPGSRARMVYDDCAREEPPLEILYEWAPDHEDGWLTLSPGPGEPSLRFGAGLEVETLRVHLIEPCRELRFELDGWVHGWAPFRSGWSCWVDRCTTGDIMQVDYCEGEEPPPCP
jgi:hypothetical protein